MSGDLDARPGAWQESERVRPGDRPVLFILDASGSMAELFGGVSRMTAARVMLTEQLARLEGTIPVGLVAYGNRIPGCESYRLYAPIRRGNRSLVQRQVQSMAPAGNTPIAATLRLIGKSVLPQHPGARIVLISDGAESCGGDPAAEAARLRTLGHDLEINVIGLSVDRDAAAQLGEVARAGGGNYFDVHNHTDFDRAIRLSVEESNEPDPAETKPEAARDPLPETNAPRAEPEPAPESRAPEQSPPLEILEAKLAGQEGDRARIRVRFRFRTERAGDFHVSLQAATRRSAEGRGGTLLPGDGLLGQGGAAFYDETTGEGEAILEIPSSQLQGRPIFVQGELWDASGVPESVYVSNSVSLNR